MSTVLGARSPSRVLRAHAVDWSETLAREAALSRERCHASMIPTMLPLILPRRSGRGRPHTTGARRCCARYDSVRCCTASGMPRKHDVRSADCRHGECIARRGRRKSKMANDKPVETESSRSASRSAWRRIEHEAEGGASGALVGGIVGVSAGPPGAIVGAILGAVAGTLAGAVIDQESTAAEQRTRELDEDIGVFGGDLGVASGVSRRPAARASTPDRRPPEPVRGSPAPASGRR